MARYGKHIFNTLWGLIPPPHGTKAHSGPGLPHYWGFTITLLYTPHPLGILWMSDQPTQRPLPDNTQHSQQTSMPPVGFELTISAGQRPQTYDLDRAASATGLAKNNYVKRSHCMLKYIYIFDSVNIDNNHNCLNTISHTVTWLLKDKVNKI